MDDVSALAGHAADLYRGELAEFAAARDALAASLKPDDATLAAAVKRLPKPSTAAWLVDLLRDHAPDVLDALVDVGTSLREGGTGLSREQRRTLDRRRRSLMADAAQQAADLGREHGQKVGAGVLHELDETLRAAVSDEAAGTAVRSGLLVKALVATGLEPLDVRGALGVPDALDLPDVVGDDGPAVEDDATPAAERKRARAESAVETATATLEERRRAADEASLRVGGAQQDVDDLTERLAAARQQLDEAEAAQERAERAAEAAEKKLDSARRTLARLTD